ncbi:VIN3-like protein 2 [Daucus carota subsp. sativus]|uniref:VIN3-like protein 2 n=1 Tax=Daucus carota subsp. sativus TaxID=79200 RepID=UPI0007EF011D|nr:PREDICTED: VIN3-like protein 2 [Daucus carota subsp. sativus]
MDSASIEEFVHDPSKCSNLSIEEKRELVYELSNRTNGASELLSSWSRQEILEILSAEIGKERKYSSLTKLKIIENLLKVVSEKKSHDIASLNHIEPEPSASSGQRSAKRQRKTDHPNKIPVTTSNLSIISVNEDLVETVFCKNSACRAKISCEDAFCRRCSCCICHQYDDNKDPSLWLTCNSEHPFQDTSCGMSCHLECALKHEKSGISKDEQETGLNGSFYCLSCGKVNDLLGCLRKQMITARDTRRVDILCYRILLSHKLLTGTKHYQKLYEIVDEAMKKLETDVGPFTGVPAKMARGIVNRLSSGPEIQRLCSSVVELLDLIPSDKGLRMSSNLAVQGIRFEDVGTSSVTVIINYKDPPLGKMSGYTLWHRKVDEGDYQAEPTCTLFEPNARFLLSGLSPATTYFFKVVYFDDNKKLRTYEAQMQTCAAGVPNPKGLEIERSISPTTNCSSLSNPSSVEDESNHQVKSCTNGNVPYSKTAGNNVNSNASDNGGLDHNTSDQRGPEGVPVSLLNEEQVPGKINSRPSFVNLEDKHSSEGPNTEVTSPRNGVNTRIQSAMEFAPSLHSSENGLPNTPCKMEKFKEGIARSIRPVPSKDLANGSGKEDNQQNGNSIMKLSTERKNDKCKETDDKEFGYYVKVIRWLECDGHIEKSFRQKFLTWYSLRATPEQVKVVKVFVDTLIDDPSSLAGQLVDSFTDVISSKRPSAAPVGLCLRLFH